MMSSGHTGERAIHSSDFSAFTKRLHCPSLLRFLTQPAIIHLHFGDCFSGTLFSSRWSAIEFRRCMPPCTRFIAREDPHSKCILCLGFSHAREAVYGTSNCKICDDFRLITLRSRLMNVNPPNFPGAHRAPTRRLVRSRSLVRPRPLVEPRAGVRMSSSRRWRVSRQASPFLSLPLPIAHVRIRRSNFCLIFSFLAQKHVISSLSG